MAFVRTSSVVAFFCILVTAIGVGNATVIEIKPDHITESTKEVTISCHPSGQELRGLEILYISILKNGKVLANIHRGSTSTNTTDIKILGRVDRNIRRSYLNMTIINSTRTDAGQYQCAIYYLKDKGVMIEAHIDKDLTVKESPDVILQNMWNFIKNMEKKMDEQTHFLQEEMKGMKSEIKGIHSEIQAINETMSKEIQEENKQIHSRMKEADTFADIKNKTVFRVYYNTNSLSLVKNGNVPLKSVYGTYHSSPYFNINDGIYKIPVSGMYVFSGKLVRYNSKSSTVDLYVYINGVKHDEYLTRIDSKTNRTYGSIYLYCRKGDQVYPALESGTNGDNQVYWVFFQGYLLSE